jgi:hypothetical protein
MRVSLLCAAVLFSGTAAASSEDRLAGASAPVLLLGNSYTQGGSLDRRLVELASATAGVDLLGGSRRLAAGGLRLPDHEARAAGADAAWVEAFELPGAWSLVVLQDQSQIPGLPTTDPYWQDSAEAARALDRRAEAVGAETLFFVTWGRRDGDTSLPELYPDFSTMNDRLEAGYLAYAAGLDAGERTARFAAVGRAFAHIHDGVADPADPGSLFHRLYASDGSHPSELGSELAAGVILAAVTGWDPVWSELPAGAQDGDLAWLQGAVRAAVRPDDELPDAWTVPARDHSSPLDVELPAETVVVSGLARCQTLVELGDHRLDGLALRVGAAHAEGEGCGRLWLDEGSLELPLVEVGVHGRQGHLVIDGGSLEAEELVLGGVGTGRMVVRAGAAELGSLAVAAGELRLEGGRLAVESSTGAVHQVGGELELPPGSEHDSLDQSGGVLVLEDPLAEGPVRFAGAVSLAGSIAVDTLADGGERVVLEAASVALDPAVVVTLPEGWTLTNTGTALRLVPSEDGGAEGGGTDDGLDPEDEAESPPPRTTGTVQVVKDEPAEGCAATASGAVGLLGLGALLGLGRRREHS